MRGVGGVTQIQPCTHEAKGFLYYAPIEPGTTDWDGLDPYWALVRLALDVYNGEAYEYDDVFDLQEVTIDGEEWDIRLNHRYGGLAPRPDDPIDGDSLLEFDITIQGHGQRGGVYQLRPRFSDMRSSDGAPVTTPFGHVADEGVSVQFQTSNMDLDVIRDLFPRVVDAFFDVADRGLYDGYFERPVGGRISEVERYVRITRNMCRKLTHQGGEFHRLAIHMSGVEGIKGEYTFDNTDAMGSLHQFRYHDRGASDLVPTHRYGKQLKAYLPENPDSFDPEDPLYHHKVGALYRKTLNSSNSVRWEDRRDLVEELDESLLNTLAWADVPTTTDGTTYVSDDHFDATAERESDVPIYDDPAPELEAEQEGLLLRTLRDLSARTDSDIEVLETLATDGGQHVEEVAEETGYGLSTIYRAIERLGDAVEVENGHVQFVSMKIAEEVRAIADEIGQFITDSARRASKLVDRAVRGAASSAFDRFLAKYDAKFEVPEGDNRPVVRIGTVLSWYKRSPQPRVQNVLDELLSAWNRDGHDVMTMANARVEAELPGGERLTGRVSALR